MALALTVAISPAEAGARGGESLAAVIPGASRQAQVVSLPHPLSPEDVSAYSRALAFQAEGQWALADRELLRAKDAVLKGHVLAQRYLNTKYPAKPSELKSWMSLYGDMPQAEAIHDLPAGKGLLGFSRLKAPVRGALRGSRVDTSDDGANWEEVVFSADRGDPALREAKTKIRRLLRDNDRDAAEAMIRDSGTLGLDEHGIDELKALIAADHFAGGRDGEAVKWANQAVERSGKDVPSAHWVAGLAQWRSGKPHLARRHFEIIATTTDVSPWMVSAGAFWAARANLVSRRPEMVNHWLEISATYPRTFYGMVARQALGYETSFSWETSVPFTQGDAEALMRNPGSKRALALLQLKASPAAEEELRRLYPRADKGLRQSILALAQGDGGMPDLAARLAGLAPGANKDSSAFPIPNWVPDGGWQVDKALVFALVRQESGFNPKAKSPAGAAGLMQLMPATARAIAGNDAAKKLANPSYNLAVGQKYVLKLLAEEPVNNNLLMLAAAYNAGPVKLEQWMEGMKHGNDPLLFIESLPSRETRAFVERVMTNLWVYRSRLGQPSPSLEAVATGGWPMYLARGEAL